MDSSVSPLVSVILATYNRYSFIEETIRSVLDQNYVNFELIIIDDGSSDGTKELISRLDDARIIYKWQENKGRSHARNQALKIAKGDYITFIDSDDVYANDKISLQVQRLEQNTPYGMVYSAAQCIDTNRKPIQQATFFAKHSGYIYDKIAFFVPITIALPTVMVRRAVLEQAGDFDERMERFEDTDLWRRLSKITPILAMPEKTCFIRTHSQNHLSSQNPESIFKALIYYAQKINTEDKDKNWLKRRLGLARLFFYYYEAFSTIPEWQEFTKKLSTLVLRTNPFFIYKMQGYPAAKLYLPPLTTQAEEEGLSFNPLVSICIPVFNGTNFLKEAIESALAQTYKKIEILVINDGSTDNGATERIALSYGDKIRYVANPQNGGVASALNLGLRHMRGDYFSWLSHDDLYMPEKIQRQVSILARIKERERTILYSDYSIFSEDSSQPEYISRISSVPPLFFRHWLTIKNQLHGCTLLIPREAFSLSGFFDESLPTTQDYDLWFRMAEHFQFVHHPDVLVKARAHPLQGSRSIKNIRQNGDTLLTGFVKKLRHDEIQKHPYEPRAIAYLTIACRMFTRGFQQAGFQALKSASRYAILSLLRFPLMLVKPKILIGHSVFLIRRIIGIIRRHI